MKLKVAGKTLKSHWKAAYDEAVKQEEMIFSLLSSEFETVFSKEIREKMVTFKFMEDRGGQLKIHSTISKKARGAFLTSLIENQVQTVEEATSLEHLPDLPTEKICHNHRNWFLLRKFRNQIREKVSRIMLTFF